MDFFILNNVLDNFLLMHCHSWYWTHDSQWLLVWWIHFILHDVHRTEDLVQNYICEDGLVIFVKACTFGISDQAWFNKNSWEGVSFSKHLIYVYWMTHFLNNSYCLNIAVILFMKMVVWATLTGGFFLRSCLACFSYPVCYTQKDLNIITQ